MARFATQTSQFHYPPSAILETKPGFVDDELAVLDDRILDNQSSDMSLMDSSRRESFEDSAVSLAPQPGLTSDEEAFQKCAQQQHFQAQARQSINQPSPFYFHGNNPFLPVSGQQTSSDEQHANPSWSAEPASGSITPTQYNGLPTWETERTSSFGNDNVPMTDFSVQAPFTQTATYPQAMSVTMSPQASQQGWMPEAHHPAKRLRQESPHPYHRSTSPIIRRDGIRKKNARFEIPAERTLDNIDQLIAQSTDEQEIKELKQQKRLLRNRQAALDSRQRKKQHTEKLEEEKKQSQIYIAELEERLTEMNAREAEYMRARAQWTEQQQFYQQTIESLQQQREEEIQNYTLQTAELRKKNNFLMEQIQRLDNGVMSAAPSSAGFSAEFSDFENIPMESSSWEDFTIPNDFSDDTEMHTSPEHFTETKTEKTEPHSIVASKNNKESAGSKSSIPPGIWLLLLFGAWVASNNSNASSTSAMIPRIMDSYRAETTSAVEAVTRSAGLDFSNPSALATVAATGTSKKVQAQAQVQSKAQIKAQAKAQPSSRAWSERKTTLSASEIASLSNSAPSSLDVLHHDLVATKEEQEAEQLFSLTPDQYNSITDTDFFTQKTDVTSSTPTPSHRPNIGEALAAMRGEKPTAAVYEKSLLWEKVPDDVVRDFKVMVSECNRQQRHADHKEAGKPKAVVA